MNLRVSSSQQEIVSILKESFKLKQSILMWQNIEGRRVTMNCIVKNLNVEQGTCLMEVVDNEVSAFIRQDATLYFKGEIQSILFKTQLKFKTKKLLAFDFPTEVRLAEKRKVERKSWQYPSSNDLHVSTSKEGRGQKHQAYSFQLLDVSEKGFGVELNSASLLTFSKGQYLQILGMNSYVIEPPVRAQIKYIREVIKKTKKNTYVKFHRCGLELEQTWSDEQFRELISFLKV